MTHPIVVPERLVKLQPKPSWLKVRAPGGERYAEVKALLRRLRLPTVCESARCPNVGTCWSAGTATVMLLGDVCTRGCRFCAVTSGRPSPLDPSEPERVAEAVRELSLEYVVLTMVDRDDLTDGGASQVRDTVVAIKQRCPTITVETLVGDFGGRLTDVDCVLCSGADVFGHNIEVTERMTSLLRDRRCEYTRSLAVLRHVKQSGRVRFTKSSLMVGVGETDDEVRTTLTDLREVGVDLLTIGQYLQPSPKHKGVERFVEPSQFAEYQRWGEELGFLAVASGPLVRSSFQALELFVLAKQPMEPEDR